MMQRNTSQVGEGIHLLKNSRIYKLGEVQRRNGMTKQTSGSASVLAIMGFFDAFNSYSAVIAESDGTLEQTSL